MIVDVNIAIERTLAVDAHQTSDAASRSPHAESSFDLVMRARAGDAGALAFLCARYLPRLRRWAHGRLPNSVRNSLDTHDLVQDTLTKVVQQLPAFEPRHEGAFQAYVRQTLLNRIRDEARRGKRRGTPEVLDTAIPSSDSSPLENAIGSETLARYEAAMARLRPADREAIIARIELRLSYTEVAACLGKPSVAAAHVAVSRALVRLANEMSHDRSR
jgi:RNA polymerase sigma-70 factor, ECF subfamily